MTCGKCHNGWILVESGGISGAERCPCSAPPPEQLRSPSLEQCIIAIRRIVRIVPFAPKDDQGAQADIADHLQKLVRSVAELDWLTEAIIGCSTEWRGFAGIRTLYLEHFAPDQLNQDNPDLAEMRYIEQVGREYTLKLAAAKRNLLTGAVSGSVPDPLAEDRERMAQTAHELAQVLNRRLSFEHTPVRLGPSPAEFEAEVMAETGPRKSPLQIRIETAELALRVNQRSGLERELEANRKLEEERIA